MKNNTEIKTQPYYSENNLPYFIYLSNNLFLSFYNCLNLLLGNLVGGRGCEKKINISWKKQINRAAEVRLTAMTVWGFYLPALVDLANQLLF